MKNVKLSQYLLNRTQEERKQQTSKAVATRRKNGSYVFSTLHCQRISENHRMHDENQRKAHSLKMRGRKTWMKGKHHSHESISKIKEKLKGRFSGEKNPYFGKHHSLQIRQKIKERTRLALSRENTKIRLLARPLQEKIFKNTKIEKELQLALIKKNIKFEVQKQILGLPDIFIEPNICVFADGCYWHGCEMCGYNNLQKQNRDAKITEELTEKGYCVFRFWEHDIKNNADKLVEKLI